MLTSIFDDLYRLNREVSRFLYDDGRPRKSYWPEVNIYENEAEYVAVAKMPGIEKNDISISVKDNSLKIAGEKRAVSGENINFHLNERKNGKFERNFLLNEKVDIEKINAEMKNGLLMVKIPKSPEAKPVTIEIK